MISITQCYISYCIPFQKQQTLNCCLPLKLGTAWWRETGSGLSACSGPRVSARRAWTSPRKRPQFSETLNRTGASSSRCTRMVSIPRRKSLADPRGRQWRTSPIDLIFFHFPTFFWGGGEIGQNNRLAPSQLWLAPPPLKNPGSATKNITFSVSSKSRRGTTSTMSLFCKSHTRKNGSFCRAARSATVLSPRRPPGPIFFHFHEVFGEKFQNNRFTLLPLRLASLPWEILDPPLVMQHWKTSLKQKRFFDERLRFK